ncbi:hypothetical protein AB832_06315 [Flavobacteriaceae bacterium (ex Bugula neritina AB1)]|nr:hypothetical protein AB832_06315 [Flavobacteriaceae bacterium (ex Bugula neritina AB1)]
MSTDEYKEKVKDIYDIALDNKKNIEGLLNECYKYSYKTYTNEIYTHNSDKENKYKITDKSSSEGSLLHSDISILGLNNATKQFHYSMFPPKKKWGRIEATELLKSLVLAQDNSTEEFDNNTKFILLERALADLSEILFDKINDNQSRFNIEIFNVLKDANISTGVVYITKGTVENPIVFRHLPIWSVVFTTDDENETEHVFYTIEMYAQQAIKKYNIKNSGLENRKDKVKIITCYIQNIEYVEEKKIKSYKESVFIETLNGERINVDGKKELKFCPIIICRTNVDNDRIYGTGLIMNNLDKIKMINLLTKYNKEQISSPLSNALIYNPNQLNMKNISSMNGLTLIPTNEELLANPLLQHIELASKNVENVGGLRKLEEEFLSEVAFDAIGGLDKLGKATLGETEIRQNEFTKKKSVEASRIQTELGDPILEICLDIIAEFYLEIVLLKPQYAPIAELLEQLFKNRKGLMRVKYTSPLSKIDDKQEVVNIMQVIEYLNIIDPTGTTSNYLMNKERVAREVMEKSHINPHLMNTDDEKKEIQKAMQEQQQQQLMLQLQQQQQGQGNNSNNNKNQ